MAALKTSPKFFSLSVAQSQALASAAGRDDGVFVLPARLKGGAAQKFVGALMDKAAVREIRAKPDIPVWRRDPETGRTYALVITKLGRASISAAGMETGVEARPDAAGKPGTAAGENTRPVQHAGSVTSAGHQGRPETAPSVAQSGPLGAAITETGASKPRSGSKLAGVIAILSRKAGASIEELTASTGWLPHTTRAALTGLRKRGYVVRREQRADGESSVYRIEPVCSAKAA